MNNEMSYREFLNLCAKEIREEYGEEISTEITDTMKNNGVEFAGLLIRKKGLSLAPNFYLQKQYSDWKGEACSLKEIVKKLMDSFEEEIKNHERVTQEVQFSWEHIRDKVFVRLVNKEKNHSLLERVPYEEYLDLALVYYARFEFSDDLQGTLLIEQTHCEQLGISEEELKAVARTNMRRDMPIRIIRMDSILLQLGEKMGVHFDGEDCQRMMYVISNPKGIFGAAVMTYEDELERISEMIEGSYYILPSSIHEVILVPAAEDSDASFFANMVRDINRTQVDPIEVLSDSVYFYDRELHIVRRVA